MTPMRTHREYVTVLKPLMPPEAFRRCPARLWYVLINAILIILCGMALRFTNALWLYLILGVVTGHSTACIAFVAHETSHNAVIRRGWMRRILEVFMWGVNFIPATLWNEVHNHTHHVHANTIKDTDRRFKASELDIKRSWYTIFLYPSGKTLPWNPLVFVQFLGYISRVVISALSGGRWGMLPAHASYTIKQRFCISGELVVILGIQGGLFALVGFDWLKYLFIGPIPLMVASCIVMAYVFTNHFLNPLLDENDPLASSTSVIVPRWVDWLHCHFSYHTEHHVFPNMDTTYSPVLSRLLTEHFPEAYNRVPIAMAWQRLWKSPPFYEDDQSLSEKVR